MLFSVALMDGGRVFVERDEECRSSPFPATRRVSSSLSAS